ncbi:hypothetical protein [Planctomyces sp. SH-PL14]|uniref:hypothetical protein n=1 Tax=Planctomyces sp. SH-PL14 TaxID=1632864 RepID=UPI00078C9030|nr:hypothetical protein [Planctomyces sp. SH-PL14]AMV18427.1 hypothetical protein VT03_11085 [Planctomyces sp. SH-PL14]
MRRRVKVEEDDGGGLDSLLDTMTNVLGILVLVIVTTQLDVKDAVKRIADSDVVQPEALEAARQKLTLTKDQAEQIRSQLGAVPMSDAGAVTVEIDDLRRKIDETRGSLATTTKTVNEYALKIQQDTKKVEEARKLLQDLKETEPKRMELKESLASALKDEARLKALLDKTPVQRAPPPKTVTLPDPRPAPEGARPVTFLCTGNRVYPIAADDLRTSIAKSAEQVVAARGLDGGPESGVNFDRFKAEFRRQNRNLRDDFFDIEVYAAGIYPRLKFTPRDKAGFHEGEVVKPRGKFTQILSTLDRTKYYAQFIVLPDSFEVYLAARAVADQAGILSGWDPQPHSFQYTTHLGGPILFGPKPPPDPNPKPAPPAKPANVID